METGEHLFNSFVFTHKLSSTNALMYKYIQSLVIEQFDVIFVLKELMAL